MACGTRYGRQWIRTTKTRPQATSHTHASVCVQQPLLTTHEMHVSRKHNRMPTETDTRNPTYTPPKRGRFVRVNTCRLELGTRAPISRSTFTNFPKGRPSGRRPACEFVCMHARAYTSETPAAMCEFMTAVWFMIGEQRHRLFAKMRPAHFFWRGCKRYAGLMCMCIP